MVHERHLGDDEKHCAFCGRAFRRDKRCTWSHWEKAKFCGRICSAKYGADLIRLDNTLQEQFDRFVIRKDGCWDWRGAKNHKKGGYAILTWRGKSYYGHKVSLELDGRAVPKGMFGCHHCDNPVCTNPEHLYVATQKQNMEDAVARNRVRNGERVHCAKLTECLVVEIRGSEAPDAAWSKKLGVHENTINMARNRKTWKHVP